MNWISLSLLGPLFWTASNFVDKYVLGKYSKGIFDFLFFSSVTSWIFFLILFFIFGKPDISISSLIPIGTGVLLIYSYGFYAKALEKGDTSNLVILFELIPVLTVILAFIFLNQTLSSNQLLGFIIVLLGAGIVSFKKGKSFLIKGFGFIIVAIVMWSVMSLFIDYGLTKMTFWHYFMLDNLGSALGGTSLLLIPRMRRGIIEGIKKATTKKYLWFSGNNLLDFFGQMGIKKAFALAPSAGLVTVLSQVQAVYAIIIGLVLTLFLPHIIKEDITATTLIKKGLGALVMFTGIYILLL